MVPADAITLTATAALAVVAVLNVIVMVPEESALVIGAVKNRSDAPSLAADASVLFRFNLEVYVFPAESATLLIEDAPSVAALFAATATTIQSPTEALVVIARVVAEVVLPNADTDVESAIKLPRPLRAPYSTMMPAVIGGRLEKRPNA